MATSNQDTNIKDVAAPASATTTNIGHVLGLNAAKTQDVLIPLSMLRTVIAAELKTALAAITSGSPDVPVLDGNNLKYMTLANFAKVVGEHIPVTGLTSFLTLKGAPSQISDGSDLDDIVTPGSYYVASHANAQTLLNAPEGRYGNARIIVITNTGSGVNQYGWQIYMDNYKIWVRSRAGNTWRGWTLWLTI